MADIKIGGNLNRAAVSHIQDLDTLKTTKGYKGQVITCLGVGLDYTWDDTIVADDDNNNTVIYVNDGGWRAASIYVFTPTSSGTLPTDYNPTNSIVVALGADVTITIDGIDVPYQAGNIVGFTAGMSYTLSNTVPVHIW
jgi:hypothetical protein